MLRPAALATLVALLTACGGGARVTGLRCANPDACQDESDPLLLKLAVDVDDPDGSLAGGQLIVRLGKSDQARYSLDPLLTSGQHSGTVVFPLPLHFSTLGDGQAFEVGVRGAKGDDETNETKRTFVVKL